MHSARGQNRLVAVNSHHGTHCYCFGICSHYAILSIMMHYDQESGVVKEGIIGMLSYYWTIGTLLAMLSVPLFQLYQAQIVGRKQGQ